MENIALESNVRANLVALQSIDKNLSITEERLATGKKVNSIIDSPTNFFAARGLNNRATQMGARLDGMGQAISTINAANAGIDAIRNLIANMKALVNDAVNQSNSDLRRDLGEQYNTVMDQMALIAQDAGYQGVNLLTSNQKLSIDFSETNGASTLVVKGLALEGPQGNGVSSVTTTQTETRASTASAGTVASVASLGSQASVASQASTSSVGTVAAVASIASQSSVASSSSVASQGTSAGQSSFGTLASISSQSSVASRSGVAASASAGTVATVASQAGFGSRASVAASASAGTVASVSVSYTQSYAFSMQVDPNNPGDTVGIRRASEAASFDASSTGNHRIDFGVDNYIDQLNALTLELDALDNSLQVQASRLATNLNIVTVRQEFTEDMISELEGGADKLVLADMNEEGANLLALQTRQSLAIQSLTLSSQQSQQILRLLS